MDVLIMSTPERFSIVRIRPRPQGLSGSDGSLDLGDLPVPEQQHGDALGGMIGDAGENVGIEQACRLAGSDDVARDADGDLAIERLVP